MLKLLTALLARGICSIGFFFHIRIAVCVAFFPLLIFLKSETWDSVQGIRSSRPRQAMMAAILIMFSCSSAATMLNMRLHWTPFVWTLLEGSEHHSETIFPSWAIPPMSPLLQWWALQRVNVSWVAISLRSALIKVSQLVLSDLIDMWRCWSLWRTHRWAKLAFYSGIVVILGAFFYSRYLSKLLTAWS